MIHGSNIPGSYVILFLQHWTLLSPPDKSTTEHHFHFGSASSFLPELLLHSSPVAHRAPTDLGSSSYSVTSFCLFTLFMGFSRKDFPGVSDGKASAYNAGNLGSIPGSGRSPREGNGYPLQYSLEKAMATHSSILAWKIPWMEEPGRLQSMGLQRVGHN